MIKIIRIIGLIAIVNFPLLHLFVPNKGFIREGGVLLPSLLFTVLALVLYKGIDVIIKKKNNSALIAGIAFLAFQIYGHIYYGIMDGFTIPYESFKHRFYLPIFLVLFAVPIVLLWKKKDIANQFLQVTSLISIVLCLQFIPRLVSYGWESPSDCSIKVVKGEKLATPDIYYIILDSYPSKVNLQKYYNFDNSTFINKLEEYGFQVVEKARSNYPYTYFSLSSSLNMRYVNDFEDSVRLAKYNDDFPFTKIHQNRVIKYLKEKKYLYVLSQSAYGQLNESSVADRYINNKSTINHFHQSLLSLSLLSAFDIGKIYHNKIYETTKQAYKNWDKIIDIPESKFVFFHCLAPHPPLVFNADGSFNSHAPPVNNRYKNKVEYVNQLKHINDRIINSIRKIKTASNNKAIIVIQGDHGTCSSFDFEDELKWPIEPNYRSLNERYGILNAVYIPGEDQSFFSVEHTPVNTFRKIFNHVFNDSLPILENKYFFGRYRPPYNIREIDFDDVAL